MDTGQQLEYDGLRRAARLAANIAGARGTAADEIAEESMALLLLQDGLVNNPKAWVRRTATRLAVRAQARQRIQADDVLEELTPTERSLVVGHRAGHALRHLARRAGLTEDQAASLLAEANRKIRRSGRRLTDVEP